jgi:hypothetical protein
MMFAIDHAATALIIKRRFTRQPMWALLISVQLMEFVWVALNLLRVERTVTEPAVASVSDIHLAYMPYSHSVLTMLGAALGAWVVLALILRRRELGVAVGVGIASHLVLDLLTHARDITLAPGIEGIRLGIGFYSSLPVAAFILELGYGILCWWIYKGGKGLLAVIVLFNLANVSFFFAGVPGPEALLANRPTLTAGLILAQIVVTLVLVGLYSRRSRPST